MKTNAVKSPALYNGLLMAIVSLGVTCFAQSPRQEHQPITVTQVSASEPGSEAAQAEESSPALSVGNSQREADEFTESRLGLSLLKNIALDQKAIWTSPIRLRWADGTWLFPLAAVTGGFFATDRAVPPALSADPKKLNRYSNFSSYGVYSLVGAGGGLYLWNSSYHDGNTNNGYLLGNTVGRMGRNIQGWLTYWRSPRNILQFVYKHNSVNQEFIPGGGAWQDYAVRNEMHLQSGLYMKTELQYEHISRYPTLFTGPQRNFTAIAEIGFSPGERGQK